MATVSLRDVRKSYAGTEVIHGVSIDVADGEFIVIVGPSGCGKSTLLRMVAGLEAITAGTIEIAGRVVNDLEPRARDIAMVFQNYALYPHMSVFDNMAYGLKIAGIRGAELRARVEKAADMLELRPYLDRKPRALSGGQRQRVAMGRALVRGPAAFLLDEPLSNLDAKLRVQMRLQIKDLQRSVDTTTLYVTHDQVEAMTLADRLIVMNAGRAEQIDAPMAIYERPASVFVAGFIGSPQMNILPATVAEGGLTLAGGQAVPLAGPLPPAGTAVLLGIRPEHLAPAAAGLAIAVHAVETLGADAYAHGRAAGVGEPVVVRLPGNAPPAAGSTLTVRPEPGFAHLFDPETGRRTARAHGGNGSDGADQLLLEHAQHPGEVGSALEDAAVHADDGILALPPGKLRALLDPVDRMLGRVAEDGEDRDVAQHRDAVVAPEAGGDHAPVKPQDRGKLGAAEDHRLRSARELRDLGTTDHRSTMAGRGAFGKRGEDACLTPRRSLH